MSIIFAILIFGLLVFIHELGHFLLAKANDIAVTEFSIGMGPRILSTVKGETRYSLKALPIGGSCMMLGEDEGAEAGERAFGNRSVWRRISVVLAGPVFNFILAFLLSMILVGQFGFDAPVISGTVDGYPAQEAGLKEGDRIVSIDGKRIHLFREISVFFLFHETDAVDVVYERDGERHEAELQVMTSETGQKMIGVTSSGWEKGSFFQTVKYSALEVRYWISTTLGSLKALVTGKMGIDQMSGPVGIVNVISDEYEASAKIGALAVFASMLNMGILLSANLGVMNLLPIPALDGGRLLFLLIEAVRGKRIEPEKEGMVHLAGMMLLLALIAFVTLHDILNLASF